MYRDLASSVLASESERLTIASFLAMNKIYPMILFSPLPCIPILLFGISSSLSKLPTTGIESYQDIALVAVTVLSILGCFGLVLAGLALPQRHPRLTPIVRSLVSCGFAAILVFIIAYSYTVWLYTDASPTAASVVSVTRGYWPLLVLFGLLAWPMVAGFRFLRRGYD